MSGNSKATLGNRLEAARKMARVTQRELAMMCGVHSHQSIANWEASKAEPSLAIIAKLATALNVTPAWLAFGPENAPITVARLEAERRAAQAVVALRKRG